MAASDFIDRLIQIIAYKFKNPSLLSKALTAPGAEGNKEGSEEEQEKYEGNRSLAQVGKSLLQVVVEDRALSTGRLKRGDIRKVLEPATAGQNHIERAKALRIDANTKLSPRQKNIAEPRTIQLTIYAIVGAVWWDCGKNFATIEDVVDRLFLGVETLNCVDPQELLFNELIVEDLSDDCNLERPQLAQYTSILSSAHDVDLIRPCNSGELNLNNFDSAALSHITQESTTSIGDEQDHGQHSPIFFDNENSVFSPLGNVSVTDENQVTALAIHFERPFSANTPVRLEITSRQEENESNNHVQQDPGRNSTKSGPVTRKRKLGVVDAESRQEIHLYNYLSLEKRRCQSMGLPFTWTDIDSTILASNKSLKSSDLATLKTLFVVIGSPESVVALQEIVKAQRVTNVGHEDLGRAYKFSPAERVKIIEGIGPGIASLVLRRRFHIYQLFLDCSQNSRRSDNFIIDTAASISRQAAPRIGNPNNLEDSRILDDMLKDVYPDLQPDADLYQKKRRFVASLRKLGKRLDILVSNFGHGILGLLSWPRSDLLEIPALAITDDQLSSLSDAVFKSFIACLKQMQGDHLCATSSAVSDVVTALFSNSLPVTSFALEEAEASKVLGFPKGSVALLGLISSV